MSEKEERNHDSSNDNPWSFDEMVDVCNKFRGLCKQIVEVHEEEILAREAYYFAMDRYARKILELELAKLELERAKARYDIAIARQEKYAGLERDLDDYLKPKIESSEVEVEKPERQGEDTA